MSLRNQAECHIQSAGPTAGSRTANTLNTCTQIAFKNILFATDFSRVSNLALPYAVEIARRSGATIHAVHVIAPDIYPLVPPTEWQQIAEEEKEFRDRTTKNLEAELEGLSHEFLSLEGDIWRCIARVIEDRSIDLLVLGTHGRTGIQKALMGSVAEKIFRQAMCPVLTVGAHVCARATHAAAAELNCILYATDFSSESFAAAPYAIYLAKEHRAELVLLHAVQKADVGEATDAFQTLRDVVPLGAGLWPRPWCTVESGPPEDCILSVAERDRADLIVLGVRGSDGHLTRTTHFSNSVAYKIMTQATCPVLTVRG
jgi:nucleotide-binding universal stress UspA family protein